jgi:hypothetical protein
MVFYQCNKCKKIWQQPIGICPECFSELERVKTNKTKVIGISKVGIASIPHPEVPYFALVLEDELGNKWAQKSVKEYVVGEEIVFNAGSDSSVAIWKTKYDAIDSFERIFSLLNVSLNENIKIVILPTLISPNHTYFRENTSPEFLDTLLRFLFEKKVKLENIKIMAQSFNEIPIEGMAQKSGLIDACLKNKIVLMDLAKSVFVKKGSLEVSEEILNADMVFNLAMMKIGKDSAIDNIFKILKKENYSALKYLQSEEDIIKELKDALINVVSIGEAEFIQKPDKTVVYSGLILGSKSFINLDKVFSEITLGKGLENENIEIVGRDIKEVRYINN